MPYKLGSKSIVELNGVHPLLVAVVKRAIEITAQDFSVHDGLRTLDQQRTMVVTGASKTMDSKHLPQADGFGHAVDLVPYLNGKLRWEWQLIWPIAESVRAAGRELRTKIRWGGAWSEITVPTAPLEQMVEDYTAMRRRQGRSAFLDGPHFEIVL